RRDVPRRVERPSPPAGARLLPLPYRRRRRAPLDLLRLPADRHLGALAAPLDGRREAGIVPSRVRGERHLHVLLAARRRAQDERCAPGKRTVAAQANAGSTFSAKSRAGSRVSRPKNSITKSGQPSPAWRPVRPVARPGGAPVP